MSNMLSSIVPFDQLLLTDYHHAFSIMFFAIDFRPGPVRPDFSFLHLQKL
jgi:hypothetical protein